MTAVRLIPGNTAHLPAVHCGMALCVTCSPTACHMVSLLRTLRESSNPVNQDALRASTGARATAHAHMVCHACSSLLQEDIWANYLEEREWMADFSYKREGEDCARGSRGASVLDFETPSVSVMHLSIGGVCAHKEEHVYSLLASCPRTLPLLPHWPRHAVLCDTHFSVEGE